MQTHQIPNLPGEHSLFWTQFKGQNRVGSLQTQEDSRMASPNDGNTDSIVPRFVQLLRSLNPLFADDAVPLYKQTSELRVLRTAELCSGRGVKV